MGYTIGAYGLTDCIDAHKWTNNTSTSISGGKTVLTGGSAASPFVLGRIDYMGIYGSLESGYIVGATTNTADNIFIWETSAGVLTNPSTPLKLSNVRGNFSTGADCYPISENKFWVTGQTHLPILVTFNKENGTYSTESFPTTGGIKPAIATSGVASFVLNEKTFVVCAENRTGTIGVFDISSGLSNAKKIGSTTQNIGANGDGGLCHNPISVNVNEIDNTAEIFVFAPNNGIAAYKLTVPQQGNEINNVDADNIKLIRTAEGIEITLDETSTVELYNINGQLLDKKLATGTYKYSLESGMYIIRINDKPIKFIK